MFGFGKRKRKREAQKMGSEAADAIRADIDDFIRANVIPHRQKYLQIMRENLVIEDETGAASVEVAHVHFGEMLENWVGEALPMFRNVAEENWVMFEQDGFPEIAVACRQRLDSALNEQSYELTCEGIEIIREEFAVRAGEPALNGAGMAEVRTIVRAMGDPNLNIDWNDVFAAAP
jgi:hypothetical protein